MSDPIVAASRTTAFALLSALTIQASDDWFQFRGPSGQGFSDAKGLPVEWSETNNIVWKTALPGIGYSSPVVAGNTIWLTESPDKGHTRHLLAVSLDSGQLLRDLALASSAAPEQCHTLNSYATPTPIVENGRVYVTFGGPGTFCLTADTGKTIWERHDFAVDYRDVGPASSPILYRDLLILTCDGQASSEQYVVALDKKTGATRWKTARTFPPDQKPDHTHSSGVPLVITVDGRDQLVSPAAKGVHAYDPDTGKELWRAWYKGWSVVPRPVYADGTLVVCSGTVQPQTLALDPRGASGTLSEGKGVLWSATRNVPDMPSPLLLDHRLYTMTATTLSCLEPRTGREIWTSKLPGQHLASPIAADGRIYLFSRGRTSTVVELGDTFRVVATNRLADGCMASPAVAGRSLIVRTTKALYRIGH